MSNFYSKKNDIDEDLLKNIIQKYNEELLQNKNKKRKKNKEKVNSRVIKSQAGKQTTVPIKDKKKLNACIDYFINLIHHAKTKIKRDQAYRNYIFFLSGINMAYRGEDLLQLKVRDVKNGYMKLKEAKTGKVLPWKLKKEFYEILLDYIKYFDLKDNDYLFVGQKKKETRNGKTYNIIYPITKQNANYFLKKMANYVNIESGCSLHTLRKTFGYQYILAGGNLLTLQKMYGHDNPIVTIRYTMWDKDDMQAEKERIFIGKKVWM